jgi:hypothetical protein
MKERPTHHQKYNQAGKAKQDARDASGYEQGAAARRSGTAMLKRECGTRTVGNIDGITTAGDAMSRPGPLRKVKSYFAR